MKHELLENKSAEGKQDGSHLDKLNVPNAATGKKPVELSDFINENNKLISALSIFTALTAFSNSLPLKPYGYVLSFGFMFLTILLWLELWGKFPKNGAGRLFWFENCLVLVGVAVFLYWLIEFRSIWKYFLYTFLALIILSIIVIPIKRLDLFNRVFHTKPGGKKFLRWAFGILVTFIALSISWGLSLLISPFINKLLDEIKEQLTALTK
jgi:hypothetical protein